MESREDRKKTEQQRLERKRKREEATKPDKIVRMAKRGEVIKKLAIKYPILWKMERDEIQRWMVKSHQETLQSLGDVDP